TQMASLKSRLPFVHFFDGFRTSHEVSKIQLIPDEDIRALIDDQLVIAHRKRALSPDNPFIRGTAQNPDLYFQGRETVNAYYLKAPQIVQDAMDAFAKRTGRRYRLFDYYGHPEASRVIVIMGSGAQTAIETAKILQSRGEKVGVVQVRLYRPFSTRHLLEALPESARKIAVLDRTKETGATGEPMYQDVVTGLMETAKKMPLVVGGRYGLSSKEFTPSMVAGIFEELKKDDPKNHFTVGITDDITHSHLAIDESFRADESDLTQALFYGLGADGTVGANKNSIKIIGENTDLHAQGYFVYDSKKSGAKTISHLRFGPRPIKMPYLIERADFIACHQFNFVDRMDMLSKANTGATFLLNAPFPAEEVWGRLPRPVQESILEKQLQLHVIDASRVARESGMGNRINTIMQTCFFALSGILPKEEAIRQIKHAIKKTYSRKGEGIVQQNYRAVDAALDHLHRVDIPDEVTNERTYPPAVPAEAPPFVREVTAALLEGRGDELPVSKVPVDGTFPSGTTRWEKRNIADSVPVWEPDLCIQCGNCSFVCPHSVIRAKFYHESRLEDAPESFPSAPINARGFPQTRYSLQIYPEDCTGCQLCVEACPAYSLEDRSIKAINMREKEPVLETQKTNLEFFEKLPLNDRSKVDFSSVRGAQFLEPLFEFSGACAGCGETPYVRLLSQLFGDRMIVANATGCSSIYGGNLPTTPWTVNAEGRGPAWSNSLFEDNAEFGMGMRITADKHLQVARDLLKGLRTELDEGLADDILQAPQRTESEIRQQRERVARLKLKLLDMDAPAANHLLSMADHLVRRSVWLVGGDGWAYDIGSAGVDHALASGRDLNILVLDTEVYSNTGGQMSKATPTAATAKFA
ncbi:MAG: pyruvate:ferredoxin (flavodoxin) oxidoreductase, partial [Saprospiraceae bacterium]|nr:pyruvate:ferredoxin (flavodoxin) oxidoreductase [Saprospiraceae bacterium]